MIATGFSQIFSSMVDMFYFIYTTGQLLWQFLSTPLVDSAPGMETLLGDLAVYTPFEFMFGPALILVLVLCVVRFMIGI